MMKVKLKPQTLLNLLARKNKSQNWLAVRLDISSGYMSQLIRGKRTPSPEMRERILKYFEQMTFDELFEIANSD